MELMIWAQFFKLYHVRLVWRLFTPASYVIMFNRHITEFIHDEVRLYQGSIGRSGDVTSSCHCCLIYGWV